MRRRFCHALIARAAFSTVTQLERLEPRQLFCDFGADGLRVNAGGGEYLDSTQLDWQPDNGFTGGVTSATPFAVEGTADAPLYQTRRWGNFDFQTETDNGGYTLTLLFAEPVMTRPGQRVFNVFNGSQPLLSNFDLIAAAGPKTAIARTFTVNVTDDQLDLHFVGVVDNAIVSGIELRALPIAPKAPSDLSASADSNANVTLAWTDHANNETGFEIERRVHGSNQAWLNVGAAATDQESFIDTSAQSHTQYDYRVHAVGENGVSPSVATTVTTPDVAPVADAQGTATSLASTLLRVDVGGAQYKDAAGNVWQSDRGASGGGTGIDTFTVAGTSDPYLFDSRRYGNFTYALPADDGNYTLKLYFMERVKTAVGQRVFNVQAEGATVLSNLDIYGQVGYHKALVKSVPVSVTGGALNLTFQSITDYAICSAIELDPVDAQPSAPAASVTLTAAAGTNRVDLSWPDSSNNEAGFELERQGPGDASFIRIATLPSNVSSYSDTAVTAGASYSYRVRAINNAGASAYSSVAQATVGQANPSAFTKVSWTTVQPSPVPRSEAQTAVVNGKLYTFGGYLDGTTLVPAARSDVYDPATNQWTPVAPMLVGLTHSGCCNDGRYVYFAGGYSGPGGGGNQTFARTNVMRYDTVTNSWSTLPGLPQARGAGGLVLLGRVLHFFGGTDLARQDRSEHWTFDLDHDTAWHVAAALPTVRNHLGAVVLNGRIYAIGGQQHQDAKEVPQSAVQMWDPANPGVWTTLTPLTQARSHIAGATFVMNGRIIVLGGETTYLHGVSTCSAYDPTTNQWVDLSPLSVARSSGNAGVINGVLYYSAGGLQKTVYKGVPG